MIDAPSDQDTLTQVGPLQLRILHAMWRRRAPSTVWDVASVLNAEPGATQLAYTTFLTVMRNLSRRGLLAQDKTAGRAHTFQVTIDEFEFKRAFLRQILDLYCQGDRAALLRYLGNDEATSGNAQPTATPA